MKRRILVNMLWALVLGGYLQSGGELQAGNTAQIWLYGYMGQLRVPLGGATIVSKEAGYIELKVGGRAIEHSGAYSVVEVAKERTAYLGFGTVKPKSVRMVWLYGFMGAEKRPFGGAGVYKTSAGYIEFTAGGRDYTHSGRYSVQE